MSEFGNAVLTSAGLALLNKAVSGEARLEFTRMALGDGTYTEEQKTPAALQTLTALRSERGSYDISTKSTVNATTVKLTALLTNWDKETGEALITEGFHQNEIGLFCKAVGDDTSEVLYSVAVADGEGTIMPAFTGRNPTQIKQSFVVSVDSSNNITITIHPGFTVDENLDETSTNPVQNKTVATEIKAIKNMQIPSEEGAFGVRYWNKKWQIKNADGTFKDASGGDNEQLSQDITALMVAVTLLKGSAINGTSGNVVVETFDDANSYVMVSGQYDKSNKRLYA